MKHLTHVQIEAYLNNSLPVDERRKIYMHLQDCPRCAALADGKAHWHAEISDGVAALTTDVSHLLPNILAESRQPAPAARLAPMVSLGMTLLFALAILLPIVPNMSLGDLPPIDAVQNEPIATSTHDLVDIAADPTDEATQIAGAGLAYAYASPVPPPQATRAASMEPPHDGE